KGAKDLLNENNGDIIKTETAFKNRMIDLMSRQCLLSAERAEKYLETANYDLGLAYRGYELDRYSLTQLALRKHKNKEAALDNLLRVIEQKRELSFSDPSSLGGAVSVFVAIME
ncbi:MAG: hypothetical protein LBC09_05350, partial [Helicobacteraceae bacterium]|nr:hypothetical protein [Helicobacteraceae bacterium]